jgi:type IV pilus assembly protein PilZ
MTLELHYQPKDLMEVYKTYMPFIKGGGLFVKTSALAKLEEEVSVYVKLPFHQEIFHFATTVAWISPEKTMLESGAAGLGIKIPEGKPQEIRHLIETHIEEYLDSAQPTDTM